MSDLTGIVDEGAQHVAHPCLSCAMREAILPALVRLAATGRWECLMVVLPVAAEILPMALGLTAGCLDDGRPVAETLDLRSTVAVVSAQDLCAAVFDDPLLADIGLALVDSDRRSVGEVVVAQVELADAIVLGTLNSGANENAYDIGSGEATSILDLAKIAASVYGAPQPEINGMFRDGDVRAASCTIADSEAALNWKPEVMVDEGLRTLCRWIDTGQRD